MAKEVIIESRATKEGERLMAQLQELYSLEVTVGFHSNAVPYEDKTSLLDVAMWNQLGTVRSPSRPFMTDAVEKHIKDYNDFLEAEEDALVKGKSDAKQMLEQLGLFAKAKMQMEIVDGSFVPNSPYTIAKKGSDKPLIDTGHMRQSVTYVVRPKSVEEVKVDDA